MGMPNRDRGVVVTGIGVVSAIGIGVTAFEENLFAGHSGTALIRSFDASRFRCQIGAEISEIDFLRHLEAKELKLLDRVSLLAVVVADEAIADAGLDLERDRAAMGVIVGT